MIDIPGPILSQSKAKTYAKKWFKIFDKDKDGKLYLDEIRTLDNLLVKTFGFKQDDDFLIKLLQLLDPDQKGFITAKDFEEIILKYLCLTKYVNSNSNYISGKIANSEVSGISSYLDLNQYGTLNSKIDCFGDRKPMKSPKSQIASSVKSELMEDCEEDDLKINNIFNTYEYEKTKVGRKKRVFKVGESSGGYSFEKRVNMELIGGKRSEYKCSYLNKLKIASFGDYNSEVNKYF